MIAPGNQLRTLGLRGTSLLGLAPGAEHAEGYTLAGVALLCQALRHEHCHLAELDLSDTGMRAEQEPQALTLTLTLTPTPTPTLTPTLTR